MPTVVFDSKYTPKVTLTQEGNVYTAVLEMDGIEPQRTLTADEQLAGISSLDPPTVSAKTPRALIAVAQRAVVSAVTATTGELGTPSQLLMSYWRIARGVRGALRMLDPDVI